MKRQLQLCILLYLTVAFGLAVPLDICPDMRNSVIGNVSDQLSYRLPKEVVPTKYQIFLTVNSLITDPIYSGRVIIGLKILSQTDSITLHSDGLDIASVDLIRENYNQDAKHARNYQELQCYLNDTKRQFYIIKAARMLESGNYTLHLNYTGLIRDDLFGFYRSTYRDNSNIQRWMAVTQFSPGYARRAFPCMDEPQLKAVFQLQIKTGYSAISNTELTNSSMKYDYLFKETPPMSTYQVGWAVHDFNSDHPRNISNFRMWTRPAMRSYMSSALLKGESIYRILNTWFEIENPIPKMDQLAVLDFNFHAMENWGMITYRESVVLFDNRETPMTYMFDGYTTMAHELAHTWFGNLVTPMFWDVAWLKEGFASYFQYFAVSMVEPKWEMMDKFVVDVLQQAMLLDSDNHNRTMNGVTNGSSSSLMTMMDFVTYKKGASVIRMLSHMIGESAFQTGLRSYLKEMLYKAATPSDLYRNLQNATDERNYLPENSTIQKIMESWTNQPGYPVVNVTRNYTTQELTVSQKRFSWDRDQKSAGWWIPLNFVIYDYQDYWHTRSSYWLTPRNTRINIRDINLAFDDFVIFNVQQTGFYRVNYDQENWRMLMYYLNSNRFHRIHKTNRAALIDDAFNLARAGYVNYSLPFNLSRYLVQERDYEPWVAATNNFKFLNKMLASTPSVQRDFQNYTASLLHNMYTELRFVDLTKDDMVTRLQREVIISTACLLRHSACVETSQKSFQYWMKYPSETSRVSPSVRSTVYCEGVRNTSSNYANYRKVKSIWQQTDMQIQKELLFQALGCCPDGECIHDLLSSSVLVDNSENVRKQHMMMIVNAVIAGNPGNVDHVLNFVQLQLQNIINLRGHDFLGKMITAIGNAMTTELQAGKLRTFIVANFEILGSTLSVAEEALTAALKNQEWIRNYEPKIAQYLSQTTINCN